MVDVAGNWVESKEGSFKSLFFVNIFFRAHTFPLSKETCVEKMCAECTFHTGI